jgi:methionyl-tRNA formyltransferase
MRFGFVTCVQLGLSCIEAFYEVGGRLEVALTLPDDKAVRKSGRVFLDDFCGRHGIPLVKTPHVNNPEACAVLRQADLDWLFIIGWSQIANSEVLGIPRRGALGMHPTLLPAGRGRAAIPWAILHGLTETGVTLFKLEEGVDTGPIAGQVRIPLTETTNASDLYSKVERAHADLMRMVVPNLVSDTVRWVSQDESQASYWPGRTPEDGRIDNKGSVWQAERLVRAVTRPYPGAFIEDDRGRTVIWSAKVHSARPGVPCLEFPDGFLEPLESSFFPRTNG